MTPTDPVRIAGQPYGRAFPVRRSYLSILEHILGQQCAREQADKIPAEFYDAMSQDVVRVQLTILPAEAK